MQKNKLSQGFSTVLILVIAAAVIGAVVAFTFSGRSTTPQTGTERTPGASSEEGMPQGETESTITDIVGRGQNLECDWRLPTTGTENPFGAGKLYTTGNKGRSQISGGTEGVAIEGNAIYKDGEVYSWISAAGTTMGFKFTKEELESMNEEMTAEQKQQAEQIRSEMIFNCKPWTPDESKFILPTGVEFR